MSSIRTVILRELQSARGHLVVVLLLASLLRLLGPGLYQLTADEMFILQSALLLARYGQWTWLSNGTHWRLVEGHSPLSDYLAAIPYLFSSDPRIGRLWVGVLGVITVAIMFFLIKRYVGRTAALFTGLLFAAHTPAVDLSRTVWGPNYGQIFIASWLMTGLLGYWEGKRWAQVLHWLALSFAIQSHPGNALLGPLSVFLIMVGWLNRPSRRNSLFRYTLAGWALFLLSLIPWGIGLYTANPEDATSLPNIREAIGDILHRDHSFTHNREPVEIKDVIGFVSGLTSSVNRRLYPSMFTGTGPAKAILSQGHWWPAGWVDIIFWAQSGLTLIAILLMLSQGIRQPWKSFPRLMIALLGLWPLVGFVASPTRISPYYIIAMFFGAVPALGVLLADFSQKGIWVRRVITTLVGTFVVAQSWLTIATMRGQYLDGNNERFKAPLQLHLSAMQQWNSMGEGREIIILNETQEGKYGPKINTMYWRVTSEGYPVRLVLMEPPQGVPIPEEGAIIASTYGGSTIPSLFGPGKLMGILTNGEPIFRWTLLHRPPELDYGLVPEGSPRFGNGTHILGISTDSKPRAGQTWPMKLVWETDRTTSEDYHFSVRIVDDQGDPYGQADMLSLNGWLWSEDDVVINHIEVPVNEMYPDDIQPRVWLLMYSDSDVPVVDEEYNWLAPWMFLSPLNPDA